jgi:hypothetical protein
MDESQTRFFSHHGSVACRWVSADVDNDVVSLATAPSFREGLLEEDFLRRRSRGRGRLRDRSGSRERTVCLDEVALDPCVPDGGATLSAFRKETTSHSSPLSEVFCATAMSRSCFISLA